MYLFLRSLFFILLFSLTLNADCPSSSWGSTTKCKVSVNDVSIEEGDSGTKTLDFNISLDDTAGKDIKIDFATADDSAIDGEDYEGSSGTATVLEGNDYVLVSIDIDGDTSYEDNETFDISLTINENSDDDAEIDDGDGVGTIENDDPQTDHVYVKSISVSESDGDISVTIGVKDGANKDLDVDWALVDDSAVKDEDYKTDNGTIHFDKGDSEKTITVTIVDDDAPEDEERFKVDLTQDDTDDTKYADGYVTINESDRLIIVGSSYDSPELREDRTPMKAIVRLIDENEKAKNDIKVNLKSTEDTATAGDDYKDIDVELTLSAGDNSISTDIDIVDDGLSEKNEKFNLNLTCVDCGNVEISESDDNGTIIDDDSEETISTGEYNDVDNYYLRDDSGDKKYKRLFCTPFNVWGDDGEVRIESNDANITQILDNGNGVKLSYHRLYAKNINVTDSGDPGEVCKEGTQECETESLARLGDSMDVNESWFDPDNVDDKVELDLPACSGGEATIYNVDEDGKQIYYNDGEYGDCNVSFKIRDKNYTKPFLFKEDFKWYGDSTIFTLDGGAYFFQNVRADGAVNIVINEDDNNPYNIARWYIQKSYHDGDGGYIFEEDSIINYEDCDGDGDRDDDDMVCQNPSKFLYWISSDADMNDVLQNDIQMSAFAYNAVGDRGDGASDASFTFDTDGDGVKNFVGALNGYRIDIDDGNTRIYWKKPDPKMKYFLGNGDRCIYTPIAYVGSDNKVFVEEDEDEADINLSVEYFTDGTRQAFCENDYNISFDWAIYERTTGSKATQDVDYEADDYSGSMLFNRECSDCDDKSCWPVLSKVADNNFKIKKDSEIEDDEFFDLNLSNPSNIKFEDPDVDEYSYIMTILEGDGKKIVTTEYNDKDNYTIKSGDNEGKYKNLFCMPVNIFDKNGMVEFNSDDDALVTQTITDGDHNYTYFHLYANKIKNDDDEDKKVISCGSDGTEPCLTQTIKDGDEMDVNTTWFHPSQIGDYVEEDVPECDGASDDDRDEVVLYNVEENGTQIVYDEMDDEFKNCVVKLKVRDSNWTKPFIFRKFLADDNVAIVYDYGRTYFIEVAMEGENQEMYINDERIKGEKIGGVDISWDTTEADFNISRVYVDTTIGSTPSFFYIGGHFNYLDCDDDGDRDLDDIDCQEPSKFLVWIRGNYDGSNMDCPSDEEEDMCTFVIKDTSMTAAYLYVDSPNLGDANKFVNKNINVDDNGDYVYFVGGMNAYLVKFNNNGRTRHIKWKKPDHRLKLFLGDSDKCVYIPRVVLSDGEDKQLETEEDTDPIDFDIRYFTDASRVTLCEQDIDLKFTYEIKQRYTNDSDKDGNATEGDDYDADDYTKDVVLSRDDSCETEDCDGNSSCLHPTVYSISDFDAKYDGETEGDEDFNLTLKNIENIELELPYEEVYTYIMTILDDSDADTLYLGLFDAYDIFKGDTNGDGYIKSDDSEDKNISTKVAGKDFDITLGSFNPDDEEELQVTDENITVKYRLVSCPESDTEEASDCEPITSVETFNSDENSEIEASFTDIDKAKKFMAIRFKVCTENNDSDGDGKDDQLILHEYDDCNENGSDCKDDDGNNQPCYKYILSSDKFAIRPEKFKLTLSKYKDLISADDINLTVDALKFNSSSKVDGNYSLEDAQDNLTIEKYKAYLKDDNETTLDGSLEFSKDFNITDAEGNTTISFDDIGKITMRIVDTKWAEVDEDDTNESQRYIVGDVNVTFIPDSFSVSASQKDYKNDFTYIANLPNDKNIGAYFNVTIKALNKDGDKTLNFDKDKWENNISIDISNSTSGAPSLEKETFSNKAVGFEDGEVTFDTNETNTTVLYNFKRDINNSINPFKVDNSEIELRVSSEYDSVTISKSINPSGDTKFLYARTNSPRGLFSEDEDQKVYIYYEVFCSGSGCDKSLLPDGSNSKFLDDPRWFINTKHTSEYGSAGDITQKGYTTGDEKVSQTQASSGNHQDYALISYDASKGHPYKTTMENKAPDWLLYNKYKSGATTNEIEVEFYNKNKGWGGNSVNDTTTQRTGSSKTNRRIAW